MAKRKSDSQPNNVASSPFTDFRPHWRTTLENTTERFDREYRQETVSLPAEVKDIDIYQQWESGNLQNFVASRFWELKTPKKKETWLDIGCGLSFLIYPWYEWNAFFYGQEVSTTVRDILLSRAPQLNSKLFRGVKLGSAHLLTYEDNLFDGVIATGWSCYYPLDYWERVLTEVKRVLKPSGYLLFDAIDPESSFAEDWAILETYLGAEVFLTPLDEWKSSIKKAGGKIVKSSSGDLFHCMQVRF